MRHFILIKAIYKVANVKVKENKLFTVYNLAKVAAETNILAQFTFAGIEWSVSYFSDVMRVSLITQEVMYSIYDGKDYTEPVLEIDILKK